MENKLTITLTNGDETRPKIEKYEELEKSFFTDTYQNAFKLVSNILSGLKDKDNSKKNEKSDYYQQVRNNIIAFIGDRGSGKTSCLQTAYQQLSAYNKDENKDLLGTSFSENFSALPTIDPSYFEEKSNILEIIIANMFLKFKEHTRCTNASGREEQDDSRYLEKKRNLVKRFQKAKDTLDRINEKDTKLSNDSIEELSGLAAGINMKQCMIDLTTCYLEYFERDVLIIAIDDMDLQTKYAFKMAEQIRKYLIIPKILILVGVKLTQLTDIIKQAYCDEYKTLLEKENSLSDTVEDIAGRYLSKLIPYKHRIFLPDLKTNLGQGIQIVSNQEKTATTNNDKDNSIDKTVLHLIYQKTRYMFYNSDTGYNLIIPRNLRDLINLISLLYAMDPISEVADQKKIFMHKNQIRFKQYFIESWCYEHLDSDMFNFIREIMSLNIEEVNKKITDYLYTICRDNNANCESRLAHTTNRAYNVSLADVDYFLDKIDGIKNKPFINYFVFALRTIYSMLLYETLEKNDDDSTNQANIDIFANRIGIKKEKDLSKALKKENKLLVYSNYERLLGGELLHIENAYNRTSDSKKQNSESIYERLLGGILLHIENAYNRTSDSKKQNSESSTPNVDNNSQNPFRDLLHHHPIDLDKLRTFYIQAIGIKSLDFNICEFFLLTIYSMSNTPFYRSNRHCYYDNFPHDIMIDKYPNQVAVYNSASILFNVVKYYRYYKQYCSLEERINSILGKADDDKEKKELQKESQKYIFWKKVREFKNKSLIYNILHFKLDEATTKNGVFENKNLEEIFIQNIEILDSLQDYLPYAGAERRKGDDDTYLGIIEKFYEKLSAFEFYLYPEVVGGKNRTFSFEVYQKINDFFSELKEPKNENSKKLFLEILLPNPETSETPKQ